MKEARITRDIDAMIALGSAIETGLNEGWLNGIEFLVLFLEWSGRSQAEIAEAFGKQQPWVSRIAGKAKEKLRDSGMLSGYGDG